MISGTFLVLLTTGLLSVVMALPFTVSYQHEADKQGYTTNQAAGQGSAQSQGFVSAKQQRLYPYWPYRYPNAVKEEGIRFPYQYLTAKEEGRRVPYYVQSQGYVSAKQQRLYPYWPYRYPNAVKEEGIRFPYQYITAKEEEQSDDAENQWDVSAKQQNLYPYWPYRYPNAAKEEGLRLLYQHLTAKEEGRRHPYNIQQQGYRLRPYAYNQGIRIRFPFKQAKKESIIYRWPQLLSGKEQGFTISFPQKQLTSANEQGFARTIGRALCKAANGNGNIAKVAAHIQMDMHIVRKAVDYLKRFGRELCNDITGNGGSMEVKESAISQLSAAEEVENELLTDNN